MKKSVLIHPLHLAWQLMLVIMFLQVNTARAQFTFQTLSQTFTNGVASTATDCNDFNTFRASLTRTNYQIVRMRSSLSGTVIATTSAANAQLLADNLRNGIATTLTDGGNTWIIGTCGGGLEIGVNTGLACNCSGGPGNAVLRPCIVNLNWGGFNGLTCAAPSQTLFLEFGYPSGANDIGVAAVDTPGFSCSAATQRVVARIENYGINQVTSATVNWSVNGILQTPVSWTGTLDTLGGAGSRVAWVFLDTLNFSTQKNILVWTSLPNSVIDTVPNNDTARTTVPGLSGTLTVGATGTYPTISSALSVVRSSGMCGPVTILLLDTFYSTSTGETFPIEITNIRGSSPTNRLIIKPDSGVHTSIVGNAPSIFNLNGAKYVTIDGQWNSSSFGRNLTVTNTSTTGNAIILQNEAIGNSIRYTNLRGANSATTSGTLVFGGSNGVVGNDSNLIERNYFGRATSGNYQVGIFSQGSSITVQNNNNTIFGNEFNSFAFNGINISGANNGNGSNWLIAENSFYDTTATSQTAIWSAINFVPGTGSGSVNNRIENNYIGGTAAFTDGTPLNLTTSTTRTLIQYTGTIGASGIIKSNIIRNIILSTSGGTGTFTGIQLSGGIVTIDSNSIDNITSFNNAVIIGINATPGNNYTISRNMINTISLFNTSTSGAIRGITASGGQVVSISGNIIKGLRTNTNNTGQNTAASLIGIVSQVGSNTVTINNNLIGTLDEPLRNNHTSTGNVSVQGIVISTGTVNVVDNVIDGLFLDSTAQTSFGSTTGASINGILNFSSLAGQTIRRNRITHLYQRSVASTQSSQINGICFAGGGSHTIDSNVVYGLFSRSTNTSTSTSAALNGIMNGSSGRSLVQFNYIDSLALIRATATSGNVNGILMFGSAGNRVANNTIKSLFMNMTSSSPSICGIQYITTIINNECEGNTIFALVNTNTAATGQIIGIRYMSGTSFTGNNSFCNRNYIHSFSSNATTTMTMTGIDIPGNLSIATFANNLIRLGVDTAGIGFTGPYNVNGIVCGLSGNAVTSRIYHNTVYIGGSPSTGSQFTAALNCTSQPFVDIRNNIFVNLTQNTGSATGFNYACRYIIQPLVGSNINYNILWAGTALNNFIGGGFTGNTNTMFGTGGWKRLSRIDGTSMQVNPGLINPGAAAASINLNLPTTNFAERAGDPTLADPVLIDYTGADRTANTPVDIGAFSSASNTLQADSSGPEITVPVLSNTASVLNRSFTATIIDRNSGIAGGTLTPRVYFNKNNGTYQFTAGTLISGNSRDGVWEFTLDYTLLGGVVPNDVIRYYVIAQDSVGIVNSNPLQAVAPAVDTITSPPTNPNLFNITNPIPLVVTVGPTGTYTTLTGTGGLFAAINNSLLQGNTTVLLESGTITENGFNGLNQWLEYNSINGTVGNFGYTLTIRPSSNSQTILSGNVTSTDGMIRINGADRVTFLGFSSTGTIADTNLVIRNIATGQPCLTYLNDASSNSILGVVFETGNTSTSTFNGGAVRISSTSLVTGNDNIVISGCHFRWSGTGGLPGLLFAASGTTGVNRENDNLLIENSTFYNFNFNAIQIGTGTGNNQVIKNNRFFQSQGLFHTSSPTVINFTPGGLSNNDTISGNTIGGTTFVLDTSYWRPSISTSLAFTAINVSAGAVTGTHIANNRIANIHHAFASGSTFASTFTGILVNNGGGVATIVNNYIGDTSIADNILHSGNTTTLPISCQTGSNSFINSNIIANITNNNPNNTSVVVNGIRAWNQTAILQINNNIIMNLKDSSANTSSSTSAAMIGINVSSSTNNILINGNLVSNLVNNSRTPGFTAQVLGIHSSSGLPVITNNTVEKLICRNINTSSITGSSLIGIWSSSFTPGQNTSNNTVRELTYDNPTPAATQVIGILQSSGSGHNISNNTVHTIRSNSSSSNTAASSSIIGIAYTGFGSPVNITGNTIYMLENSNTSANSNIAGIFLQTTTTNVFSTISRNFIHSFRLSTTFGGRMNGIQQSSGSFSRYTNNMIRLGIDSSGTAYTGPYEVNGIITEIVGNFEYYHNSIYLGGAPSSGFAVTAAIRVLGTPTGSQNYDFRNNILVNAITNTGSASGKNFGLRIAGIPTAAASIQSNYNIFHTPGTGGFVAGTNTLDYTTLTGVSGWKTLTSYDLQSGSGNPLFVDATGGVGLVDLHLQSSNPAEASGDASISSIVSTDFDGTNRNTLTPTDIGADAGNFTLSSDIIAPLITFTPLSNQGNLSGPLPFGNVVIRDNAGIQLIGNAPKVYYRKGTSGTYSSVFPVSFTGSPTNATFAFEIDYSIIGSVTTGDTIFYYVIAQDSLGGNMMSQVPFAVATDVNTVTQHPANPNFYTLLPVIPANSKFYVGAGQTYPNLTGVGGLFEFLNTNTIGGNITAVITSNITEPGTFQLNQLGEDGVGSGSFTVTIRPDSSAVTPRVVSGAVTGIGMLVLNGADRVKILGIPDSSVNNTLRNLIIRNNGGPAINFINGAQQNKLQNVILEGSNTTPFNAINQGVISFAGSTNSFGNSQDSIINCQVRNVSTLTPPAGIPGILVGSYHTGLILNANNVVSGCELFNGSSAYINVEIGSGNGWRITNNSLYNNLPSVTANALPIRFNGGILSEGHTISGNAIGGGSPNTGGATWTSSVFAAWNMIQINVGLNLTTVVQSNTIRNISFNQTSSAQQWNGIILTGGRVNVLNNMFGDSTVSNSIFIASPNIHNGIVLNSSVTSPVTISGNRMAGMSFINPGNSVGFNGINVGGGITTISNNSIGATGVANSITHDGNSAIRGIVITSAVNVDPSTQVINNSIANITSFATQSNASAGGIVQTGNTVSNISGNTIFNISSLSTISSLTPNNCAAFGIGLSATTNPGLTIANNTVFNISASNSGSFVTHAMGIAVQSANSATITGNRIYQINNLSTSAAVNPMATANGIVLFGMQNRVDVMNNQITLGTGQTNNVQFNGIWQNTSGGFDVNCYYNTVLIGGTVNAGNLPSFAFHRGNNSTGEVTSVTRLVNNVLVNQRTGGTTKNYAVANEVFGLPIGTGWQEANYNLLVSANAANVGLWGTADRDINTWRVSSNADRTSWSVLASVLNPSAVFTSTATGNLNVVTTAPQSWYMNGKGIAGAASNSINTDFNGNSRGTTVGFGTDIGSHEFTTSTVPPAVSFSSAPAANTTSVITFASRELGSITWGSSGVLPTGMSGAYYSGTTPPNSFPGARHLNAYLQLTATGGSGFNYNMTLNYDPALLGNVLSASNLRWALNTTGTWTVDNSSVVNTTLRSVSTASPFTAFGSITATDNSAPLPVQLLQFTAQGKGNDVVLNWSTASEQNNLGFEIERSLDGTEFSFVTFKEGKMNTTQTTNYIHTDKDAFLSSTTWYYRLKQVDKDGTYSYSDIVRVSASDMGTLSGIQVFPNPFVNELNINMTAHSVGTAEIQLFDIQGRSVHQQISTVSVGSNLIPVLSESALQSGVYFIRVSLHGETTTIKVIHVNP